MDGVFVCLLRLRRNKRRQPPFCRCQKTLQRAAALRMPTNESKAPPSRQRGVDANRQQPSPLRSLPPWHAALNKMAARRTLAQYGCIVQKRGVGTQERRQKSPRRPGGGTPLGCGPSLGLARAVKGCDLRGCGEAQGVAFSGPEGPLQQCAAFCRHVTFSKNKKSNPKTGEEPPRPLQQKRRCPTPKTQQMQTGGIYKRHKGGSDANPAPLATIIVRGVPSAGPGTPRTQNGAGAGW